MRTIVVILRKKALVGLKKGKDRHLDKMHDSTEVNCSSFSFVGEVDDVKNKGTRGGFLLASSLLKCVPEGNVSNEDCRGLPAHSCFIM